MTWKNSYTLQKWNQILKTCLHFCLIDGQSDLFRFRSATSPSSNLFITAMCDIAYTATTWQNYTLQPGLFAPSQLMETLPICFFHFRMNSRFKIHVTIHRNTANKRMFQNVELMMRGTSLYLLLLTRSHLRSQKNTYIYFFGNSIFVGADGWLKCDTTPIGFSTLLHAGYVMYKKVLCPI